MNYAAEHIFELQAIKGFIISTISGTLTSGLSSIHGAVNPVFWTDIMERIDTSRPGVKRANTQSSFMDHLMNQLGSIWNPKVFALAGKDINGIKAQVCNFERVFTLPTTVSLTMHPHHEAMER